MKTRKKLPEAKVEYIVIHTTTTSPNMLFKATKDLPYHYLIAASGKLTNIREVSVSDTRVEIGIVGGLDEAGAYADTRTPEQNDTLFNALIYLTESFRDATIVGADELNLFPFANPGFCIKKWLNEYVPSFLEMA